MSCMDLEGPAEVAVWLHNELTQGADEGRIDERIVVKQLDHDHSDRLTQGCRNSEPLMNGAWVTRANKPVHEQGSPDDRLLLLTEALALVPLCNCESWSTVSS